MREKPQRLNSLRTHLLQYAAQAPIQSTIEPRHGEVQRTIIKILEEAAGAMSVQQVHEAIERMLSKPLAKSTVGNCLVTKSRGNNSLFNRVKHGQYCIVTQV